jgi:ribosomal protein RSM22 (predicted rRNA methylase)
MELPAALRQAVDAALSGAPLADLAAAALTLSARYRGEVRDGAMHISGDLAARAYLATRLPATYAAISAAFAALAEMRPDFAPRSLLDIGAGPGTAMWAASQIWPVSDALLVERNGPIRSYGERIAALAPVHAIRWQDADIARGLPDAPRSDLAIIAYVLNELEPAAADRLVEAVWLLTSDTLAVVEPGTPAGWKRILQVRDKLLGAGAHIVAPCPHAQRCPLAEPDWCHFSRKVARSRIHRLAKGADMPWEDEKFIFLAASRHPAGMAIQGRVLAPPKTGSGRVSLKICSTDGTAGERLFTRREGEAYKIARRLDWGDVLPTADRPDLAGQP